MSGVRMSWDMSGLGVFSSRGSSYSKLSFNAKQSRIQTRAFSRSFNVCKVYNAACAALLFLKETLFEREENTNRGFTFPYSAMFVDRFTSPLCNPLFFQAVFHSW